MSEVIVTRNGQITLAKDVRDKLDIREGDHVIVNVVEHNILITKKDPASWNKIKGGFLPKNFPQILKQMRGDTAKRLKRLGIVK